MHYAPTCCCALCRSVVLADPEAVGGSIGSLVNSLRLFYKHHYRTEAEPATSSGKGSRHKQGFAAEGAQLRLRQIGERLGTALLVLQVRAARQPSASLEALCAELRGGSTAHVPSASRAAACAVYHTTHSA